MLLMPFDALATPRFPTLTGQIVDEAHLLSPNDQSQILSKLQSDTQNQVVVVTLSSLDGYDISDYGYQLGRHWGIGHAGKDNGVLLIVAPNERMVRIEVGYGLEGTLTDAKASQIIFQMTPALKANNYPKAILIGVQGIMDTIRNADIQRAGSKKQTGGEDWQAEDIIFLLFIFFLIFPRPFILLFIFLFLGRKKAYAFYKKYGALGIFLGGGGMWGGSGGGGSFRGGGGSFGGGGASGRF